MHFKTLYHLQLGAVGVLWCNVLVNADTGRGMLFKPTMILDFLNPAFQAINFCTISCITVGITLGIAQEIGVWNMTAEKAGYIPGLVGLATWLSVTNTSHVVKGAKEAFTGMIIGILSVELFCFFEKQDALKIKMPDQVPPGVARAFEVLIPATLTLIVTSCIGSACYHLTGLYLNDVIKNGIQGPLGSIGATIPGVLVIYLLLGLFWLVGIHGANMLVTVKESLFTPLALENVEAFSKGQTPKNVINMYFLQMCGEFSGAGATRGLVIAILIFSKRDDNKAIASLSLVPGLFNINETVIFGIHLY